MDGAYANGIREKVKIYPQMGVKARERTASDFGNKVLKIWGWRYRQIGLIHTHRVLDAYPGT